MKAIQSLYGEGTIGHVVDNVFAFFTFFGEETFVLLLGMVFYWSINKRIGEKLILCMYASLGVNCLLKGIIMRPRPFIGEPGVYRHVIFDNGLIDTNLTTSSSFPSGHSQCASSYAYALSTERRRMGLGRWFVALAVVVPILVALSRVYLGVHYPSDILAGLIIGVVVSVGVCILYDRLYEKRIWLFVGVIVVMSVVGLIFPSSDMAKTVGAGLGFLAGYVIEERQVRFHPEVGKVWAKVLRVVIGFAVIMALRIGLKAIMPSGDIFGLVRYMIIGFVGAYVCPLIFSKIKL